MIEGLIEGAIEALYPSRCAACDRIGAQFWCSVCAVGLERAGPFDIQGIGSARAGFVYRGPIVRAIRRWKFAGAWWLARDLARAIESEARVLRTDAWVPVPLDSERARTRGFNPSSELARALGGPVWHGLVRRRATGTQLGRTRVQRLAADLGYEGTGRRIDGAQVTVVDDVCTTGATARAVGRVLLKQGARSVSLLVVARSETEP